MSNESQIEALKKLRAPFPENLMGWLPKPMLKKEDMDKIPKHNCDICGQYHARDKVVHLSYVGHAALTDRLLDVDPLWNWEPFSVTADGAPAVDKDGGMWIKLTVAGMTRIGYGDAQAGGIKTGANATKERIGDALRNAAMRFGCALELWHKGDLNKHKITAPGASIDVDEGDITPPAEPPKPTEKPTISNTGLNTSIKRIMAKDLTVDRLLENRKLNEKQMEALDKWTGGAEWVDLEVEA